MNLLTERDSSGKVTAKYTHGHTPIDGIASTVAVKRTDAGSTYYQFPLYDHRGNVAVVTDENAVAVGYFEYDAWGTKLRDDAPVEGTRFGQSAPAWLDLPDSDGSLALSPTRLYHKPSGRWLQRDPVGYADGMSLYQSFRGNPMRSTDPAGLYGKDVHEDLTFLLALGAGIDEAGAKKIAEANQGADEEFGAPQNRLEGLVDCTKEVLVDFLHLPGANTNLGEGMVDRNSEATRSILQAMEDAAFKGTGQLILQKYSYLETRGAKEENTFKLRESCSFTIASSGNLPSRSLHSIIFGTPELMCFAFRMTTVFITAEDRVEMMGLYLHSLQDSFAHHGGQLGHGTLDIEDPVTKKVHKAWWATTHADVPYLRPRVALAAAKETYDKLLAFLQTKPGVKTAGAGASWEDIQPMVKTFVEARQAEGPKGKAESYADMVKFLQTRFNYRIARPYSGSMPEIKVFDPTGLTRGEPIKDLEP